MLICNNCRVLCQLQMLKTIPLHYCYVVSLQLIQSLQAMGMKMDKGHSLLRIGIKVMQNILSHHWLDNITLALVCRPFSPEEAMYSMKLAPKCGAYITTNNYYGLHTCRLVLNSSVLNMVCSELWPFCDPEARKVTSQSQRITVALYSFMSYCLRELGGARIDKRNWKARPVSPEEWRHWPWHSSSCTLFF